jgi:hypothetical protein
LYGMGAAGPGVEQEIFSQLTPEMQAAAQQMVLEGRAQNITAAATYILEHPEVIDPPPMETSRSVGWWLVLGAGVFFGGSLLWHLLKDDRERNPAQEDILGAVIDALPARGALDINELHEAAKNAYEDRGWGIARWSRADTDDAVMEGMRLYIIDEVPGGYARAAGRRRIPKDIMDEGLERREARRAARREDFQQEQEAELRSQAAAMRRKLSEEESQAIKALAQGGF